MTEPRPSIDELVVGDEPASWTAAGFTVDGDTCRIGTVRVRLAGRDAGSGITAWSLRDLVAAGDIDGIPTSSSDRAPATPGQHACGARLVDHVVLMSPDGERTAAAVTAATGPPDAIDALQHAVAGQLGLVVEALELGEAPLAQHRGGEHRVVVHLEVVDARAGDGGGVGAEVDDAGARHLEGADLALDGAHRGRRVDLERGAHQVAVEEEVQVLVGGDAVHQRHADRVGEVLAGVAVRHAGGELLHGHVGQAVERAGRLGHLAPADLLHAGPLELHRVEQPGDREVVAHHDRVATLFGGPTAAPRAPRLIGAVHALDGVEVVGQVVLGEEVHEQGAAHPVGQRLTGGVPDLVRLEVAAPAPGDELVGEPLLGALEVGVEQPLHDRGELGDDAGRVRHGSSLPTGR